MLNIQKLSDDIDISRNCSVLCFRGAAWCSG